MDNNINKYDEKIFEKIKHFNEYKREFWYARELMPLLEYTKWENFHKVIKRAMIACETSKNNVSEQFPEFRKPIIGGNGNVQHIIDYRLSRYACYLIVQNANPRKKAVALGQTYFAIQTRKMELSQEEYSKLSENEKRLYTRINIKNKNKYLFEAARKSGVKNYAKFNDFGYKGLYGGETAKQIAKRKGIDEKKDNILDYMGSTELAANLFRITQTDEVLKNKDIKNENEACITHHQVGKAVRQTIEKIGGTLPEKLPTPKKSIKQIENERSKRINI